ncbi:MAG: hypothetical protein A3E80_01635 [Chlamydiae bacterium RIFCSPHIGHO2_12_FULL_49_9]|nr:MAG: hypothetical protein A3E80_01635 [Chlamydiae bacterium RIFCSPHIGHO2_12_FULL_49_9]
MEILIALSLTALLLTMLFSFLVDSAKIKAKLDPVRSEILSREQLQTRLQGLFSSLGKEGGSFYTRIFPDEAGKSLLAIFDNGVDPDPLFSGSTLGKIYLDKESNLSLALWPEEKGENLPWRKEILLTNVSHFEFEFLAKKSPASAPMAKKEKTKPINPNLEWRTDWPKSLSGIPAMIRLRVDRKKDPSLLFAFHIPTIEPFITYQEGVR